VKFFVATHTFKGEPYSWPNPTWSDVAARLSACAPRRFRADSGAILGDNLLKIDRVVNKDSNLMSDHFLTTLSIQKPCAKSSEDIIALRGRTVPKIGLRTLVASSFQILKEFVSRELHPRNLRHGGLLEYFFNANFDSLCLGAHTQPNRNSSPSAAPRQPFAEAFAWLFSP